MQATNDCVIMREERPEDRDPSPLSGWQNTQTRKKNPIMAKPPKGGTQSYGPKVNDYGRRVAEDDGV
jgi:hypothetical protein